MRYAVRWLLKNPGFGVVAVVSLALGIGANTLMFSIVHAVLIRSLPYPDSDRLVFVWFIPPNHPEQKRPATLASYLALRAQNRALEYVGTVGGVDDTATLAGGTGDPLEQVASQRFSAAIPQALSAKPLKGRWFTEGESQAGLSPVIVISYALWQHRFAGAGDVLGKVVRVDGQSATVIGVMPEGWMLFNYPAQFWAPYRLGSGISGAPDRVLPLARLRRGVTLAIAQGEMNRFAMALGEAFPSTNKGWGIRLEPALNVYVGWVRRPLLIVQCVVALVLLIACANVAGLLLMKAAERKMEVAVRAALGAGRWPIARQFLIESLLLALLGGLAGIALAHAGLRFFMAISPVWFPRAGEVALDFRMLGFTILLSIGTALIFGAIPAVQSSRPDLIQTLKKTTRSATADNRQQKLRSALVALEMALATVLLVAAGLMLNTFLRLYNSPAGCDTHNVLTFQVSLPSSEYVQNVKVIAGESNLEISPRAAATFQQILDQTSSIRGVESAAESIRPPLSESALGGLNLNFKSVGHAANGLENQPHSAAWFPVSAGYFHALGIPVLRGREFRLAESAGPRVILVNEAMARRFWPGEDPIGKRLQVDLPGEGTREIVGVVGDVRHNRYQREVLPQMYVPYVQQPTVTQSRWLAARLNTTFVIRTYGDPMRLVPTLRAAVAKVDRTLPIFNIKTLESYVADQLWQPKQTMILLVIFGTIAVILAVTGVYGVMAYAVRQRTYEIGIRIALGATTGDVLHLVIARGLLLSVLGVSVGVAISRVLMRFVATLLWGVTPADPLTYSIVILAMVIVAALACYLPARRAIEIEVTTALRCE